ncbi:MAG: cytochrome c [Vicinamibacterales bacterium]
MRTLALTTMLMAGALAVVSAQGPGPVPREPMVQKTTVGSEFYRFYCANCHGLDAKGRPATAAMRVPASNLTTLALNHGGVFPREAVRDVVTNGAGKGGVHGTSDMPVWGTIFRAFEPNDTMVQVRIDNLIRYIESLQVSTVGTGHAH